MALTFNGFLRMALVKRMTVLALFGLALFATATISRAQGTFQIRFDTVLAKAGDTVTVAARYTFVPKGSHNINSYSAILDWDTSELHLVAFVLDSTATLASDTNLVGTSHHGISAIGQTEIDLTNPVLFKIRFLVDSHFADTAFIGWDTNSILIDPMEGVGTVTRQGGWIRTSSIAGHVSLETPARTVKGYTQGFFADSVGFDLPVIISNVAPANMHHAQLSFTWDSTAVSWDGQIASGTEKLRVDSITFTPLEAGIEAATLSFSSNGSSIQGADTLVVLKMVGLVWTDTFCEALTDVSLRPSDSNAFIGNTDYTASPICLEWEARMSVAASGSINDLSVYPNPASGEAWITSEDESADLNVYDRIGRMVFSGKLENGLWRIPNSIASGIYEAIVGSNGRLRKAKIAIQ